jgi:hypothetical protein
MHIGFHWPPITRDRKAGDASEETVESAALTCRDAAQALVSHLPCVTLVYSIGFIVDQNHPIEAFLASTGPRLPASPG